MDPARAMEIFAKELTDELVITNISTTARELYNARDRERNLYSITMGLATSVGLGLALALASKRVVVLDGDGSLLMNLGTLATIANENPDNLVVIVFDNECYEGPGGHPTATAGKTDLAAVARGAGIATSTRTAELAEFSAAIKKALSSHELAFIVAKVEKGTKAKAPIGVHNIEATYRLLGSLRDEGLIPPWYE